jgi:hypothetical protein
VTYIHTYHSRFTPEGQQRYLRYFSETPSFYQNQFAMWNTADVTNGKPTAVFLQSLFCLLSIYPLSGIDKISLQCAYFGLNNLCVAVQNINYNITIGEEYKLQVKLDDIKQISAKELVNKV